MSHVSDTAATAEAVAAEVPQEIKDRYVGWQRRAMTTTGRDAEPFAAVPPSVKGQPRWVCWRKENRNGKLTKVPITATDLVNAKSNDPTTWSDFERVVGACRDNEPPYCEGIGFMLGDGWAGVDLDNCFDDNGALKPWARPIVEQFAATYMEVSPSGKGIKVLCRGSIARGRNKRFADGAIEVYSSGRFFTITGSRYGVASEAADMQSDLDGLLREQFADDGARPDGDDAEAAVDFNAATWAADDGGAAQSDDTAIIERIHSREREGPLWRGSHGAYGSQSEADLALCGYIASQTSDRAQIDRIFRQSALMRPKWDELRGEKTYGEQTIDLAMKPQRHTTTPKPRASYPLTDMGNAEHFVALHGADVRYVAEWKSWIFWDGRRWKIDAGAKRVERRAMQFIQRDLFSHANGLADADKRAAALKWAMLSQQGKRLDVMLGRAASMVAIEAEQLDRNAWLFNVRNGTIDLRSGALRPHDRTDLITKLAPVDYDAGATCPTWEAVVARSLPTELAGYVQKAVGYSMTGDCSEKACFMLIGPSNTGKSTFSDTVKVLMGDYGLTAQQSVVLQTDKGSKTNSEDEANLMGMRFVSVSEPGEGQRWDEAKLKRMVPSNGSRIRARRLHENSFEFDATHKIWLDANHRPTVRGATDDAVWSRIKLIPFEYVVKPGERDGALPTKLRAEASGILNWMIRGLIVWRVEGLAANEPTTIRAAVNDYREDNDTLGQFLRDRVTPNDAGKTPKAVLYHAYKGWCMENGIDHPLNRNALGRKLADLGYPPDAGKRFYTRMELRDCDATADATADDWGR